MKKLSLSTLDNAEIYHVYDYYDEPLCYSIELDSKYFIVFFADYYSNESVRLYLPVSKEELTSLEKSENTMGDYYNTHKNVLVMLRYDKEDTKDKPSLYTEKFSDVDRSMLPDENATISV